MGTAAQFKVGEVVWYWTSNSAKELAVVTEVTQVEPAQYHVALTRDSSVVTCGEGVSEPGAISAL